MLWLLLNALREPYTLVNRIHVDDKHGCFNNNSMTFLLKGHPGLFPEMIVFSPCVDLIFDLVNIVRFDESKVMTSSGIGVRCIDEFTLSSVFNVAL